MSGIRGRRGRKGLREGKEKDVEDRKVSTNTGETKWTKAARTTRRDWWEDSRGEKNSAVVCNWPRTYTTANLEPN